MTAQVSRYAQHGKQSIDNLELCRALQVNWPLMKYQMETKVPKWPFIILGDVVLLGLAWLVYAQSKPPMDRWEAALFIFSGALGAALAILPFVLEYRAAVKLVDAGALITTASQIQNLELLAKQIGNATSQWQNIGELSNGSVTAAKEIAERMNAETAAFTEFMEKANHTENANLRLEVDKLRRAENDWLQIVVRILDHTYALHKAAIRSGQPSVIEQLTNFQNACRDVARRAGLIPVVPAANEPFDPERHQSTDSQVASIANPRVLDTVATGFTYQGRSIRAALVSLQNPPPAIVPVQNNGSNGSNGSATPSKIDGKPAEKLLEERS